MTTLTLERKQNSDLHLAQAIEPLASYICAADRPKETLLSALAALVEEVKQTNQVALMHFSGLRIDSLGLI
jgi:hypothetical protein